GTPGAGREGGAAPVTLRIRGREVGRALATPGSTVSITLPSLGPGWWVGEVVLDADELRADDRRLLVWRVAPPVRVTAPPSAGGGVAGGGRQRPAPRQPARHCVDGAARDTGVRPVCGCADEPPGTG